jgi:predicted GTPase
MPFGAGTVAARHGGAMTLVDPRPYAVGSLRDTFARYPHLTSVLPAMGYGPAQAADLAATIAATPCDVVVSGTPFDLQRVVAIDRPVRRASYELAEVGHPTLAEVLAPHLARWTSARAVTV